MELGSKIYVAGHQGLVGSALLRALTQGGYHNVITRPFSELDLRNQKAVTDFFDQQRPDYVFLAAARVGGIYANMTYPADFIYDNLMIEANVIHAAYQHEVKKLLFLGSSCIYPRDCLQPIKEEYLLTGPLETTNESYAIAKIAGLKLCQSYNRQFGTNFIMAMPTNLYGPGDTFDVQNSHVIPALIAQFIMAHREGLPQVSVWGSGRAMREFLYVDDLAQALLFLMERYNGNDWINVGTGEDCSIAQLAQLIGEVVGYNGTIVFDTTKPDGTPRKLLDVSCINKFGWKSKINLREGIFRTTVWYKNFL